MDQRIGVIGIIVEDLNYSAPLNEILHFYANIIVGRMGIPYRERGISVLSVIVDGKNDEIKAMTEKIEKLPGISVKSALTKESTK